MIAAAFCKRRQQRGMTLLVVLIMLVMITLFVVSMVRLSSINAVVVGNMQAQKVVDTEANQALEIAVNKFEFFNDAINNQNSWASNATTISYSTLWSAYTPTGASATTPSSLSTITIHRPQCLYAAPASGYSALSTVSPQDTNWDVQVDAADSVSSATTEMHQGLKMRLPAGSC
jgi:Tfp pilus assembly protein PilX